MNPSSQSMLWLLVSVIVLVIVAQIVLRAVIPKRPSARTFRCARCNAITEHGDRTVFAWTRGERDFYCDPCNDAWLENATPRQRAKYERNMARMARSRSNRRSRARPSHKAGS